MRTEHIEIIGGKIMNVVFLNNYSKQLESKKHELIRQLQNQVAEIDIPTENSTNVPTSIERKNHIPPYVTATGAAMFLIGLCSKSTFCSILGGLTLGAGAYMWYKDKGTQPSLVQQKPNYTVLASKVNDALRNIHTSISSDWDSFVSKQVSDIKSQYVTFQLSEEQRNKINDLLMTHPIISFSIMDVFPKLMSISRTGDLDAFNKFLTTFRDEYLSVINAAVLSQSEKILEISEILN